MQSFEYALEEKMKYMMLVQTSITTLIFVVANLIFKGSVKILNILIFFLFVLLVCYLISSDKGDPSPNKSVWQYLATSRIDLHFLPPYSPNLNPIER